MTLKSVNFLQNKETGSIIDLSSVRNSKSFYHDLKIVVAIRNKAVQCLEIASVPYSLVYSTKRKKQKAINTLTARINAVDNLLNLLGYEVI